MRALMVWCAVGLCACSEGLINEPDSGALPVADAGVRPPTDSGTPQTSDAGTQQMTDAGTPPSLDGGPTADAGPSPDAGTTHGVDAGPILVTGAPRIVFTDAVTGPTSGGEYDAGAYLSIFGTNFGDPSNLGGSTKVFIGDAEVANYRALISARVSGKWALQHLAVQVGHLGGAANGTALPIKVVVAGVSSNTDLTFTPCAGRMLFVSKTGNDDAAIAGDIAHPWRSLQNVDAAKGAYFTMRKGDHIVIRGGEWSDTNGVDTTWMRAGNGTAANGAANAWIHITAYPGPINGNAIEDVHSTTPAGTSGGIAGPWSAIAGVSGEYWSISNLRMEIAGGAARDAAPINFQYTAGPWRVVNNELGPWPVGNSAVLNAAGISGHGKGHRILGNLIHDIEGTSELQNHGIYADTTAEDWEIAFNWIHDIRGGSLIQFNDNEGGAGTYALPHGGTWRGFVGMRVHHNWLENAAKYGINYNDQASAKAGLYEGQHWNNVIIGTGLPPIRINSTADQSLSFAFNTLFNCMTTSSGSGNAYFRNEGWAGGPSLTVANTFFNNIVAYGPKTVTGTVYLADSGAQGAYSVTATTWSFKRNDYFARTHTPAAPSTFGDSSAVIGDPMFTSPTDFTLKSPSPAIHAATQTLPSGFTVNDDFTALKARPVTPTIGAFE